MKYVDSGSKTQEFIHSPSQRKVRKLSDLAVYKDTHHQKHSDSHNSRNKNPFTFVNSAYEKQKGKIIFAGFLLFLVYIFLGIPYFYLENTKKEVTENIQKNIYTNESLNAIKTLGSLYSYINQPFIFIGNTNYLQNRFNCLTTLQDLTESQIAVNQIVKDNSFFENHYQKQNFETTNSLKALINQHSVFITTNLLTVTQDEVAHATGCFGLQTKITTKLAQQETDIIKIRERDTFYTVNLLGNKSYSLVFYTTDTNKKYVMNDSRLLLFENGIFKGLKKNTSPLPLQTFITLQDLGDYILQNSQTNGVIIIPTQGTFDENDFATNLNQALFTLQPHSSQLNETLNMIENNQGLLILNSVSYSKSDIINLL